ncbi:MAG TPA: MFS transporter [Steroidobacteraceae bacterium]|nr:MFS transporter [Steroidobacteraceae bacterium]
MQSAKPRSLRLGARLIRAARVEPRERRAVALAFACYFVLFASYYILRPVRDTIATDFGVNELPLLFAGTFVGSLIASPLYAAAAARFPLQRLLPGVFWFWLLNVLLFDALLAAYPASRLVAAAYFVWFSVVNLFMVSVFWSLMADSFSPDQSARLFPLFAAGGELGAIAGPLVTRLAVHAIGLGGLLLVAAGGFLVVILLIHLLMHEKASLRQSGEAQRSTLDHALPGNPFEGFGEVLKSAYSRNQAAFMFLMTWVATVAYFFQTEIIASSVSGVAGRAVAVADIALAVNICSAVILIGGLGRFIQRFGVTASLVATPVIMMAAFVVVALSPTLFMIQAIQVVRSVTQFAVARPSREICFTVVEQSRRYKGKNVIDTVVYRLGDVTSAWFQAGLRAAGLHITGASMVGIGASLVWGAVALALGRRYEARRAGAYRALEQGAPSPPPASWL